MGSFWEGLFSAMNPGLTTFHMQDGEEVPAEEFPAPMWWESAYAQ